MLPFLTDRFGNPSSEHAIGHDARSAVEHARGCVARLLGTESRQIIFTSGGTESNNLAILGTLLQQVLDGRPTHLVISAIEHASTIAPAQFLERLGCQVTVVGCSPQGVVGPEAVLEVLRPETALVSIMHANNEIGTLQPIRDIATQCRKRGILVHTDAAQSAGKIVIHVSDLGVDLLSVAGHKLYAPKGIGALYIRSGIMLAPVLRGAGQEEGFRPGTENVPHIVALGAAADQASSELTLMTKRMTRFRDRLELRLRAGIGDDMVVHGIASPRLPNTLSVSFPGVRGAELLARCPEVCASVGAACHQELDAASTTLAAIGVSGDVARGTVRLSVGWPTTDADIEMAADCLLSTWRASQ